jgi:hypothetical protein
MRVNREHLLGVLEAVAAAAARKPSFRQAGCLAFVKGRVAAFDGDVACSEKSPLNGVTGAVAAETLMEYLRALTEEELDVDAADGVLRLRGKGRRMKFAMEKDVVLPLDQIEPAKGWEPLPDDFCEAAACVSDCAGKDERYFDATCVNVHPEWLEAHDYSQIMRHAIDTGVGAPFLIQRNAIKQACAMGATHWSLAERWTHFKNGSDFVLSCLRFPEVEYPSDALTLALEPEGEEVTLPRGLAQAAALAELASKEMKDDNFVEVTLRPGEAWIKGRGVTAEYEERRKISYRGPEMTFCVSPALLATLAEKYDAARVTEGKLVVDGGRWRYAVRLKLPEGK